MNKDFSKHNQLINKFRGKVNKSDFESAFTAATGQLTKNERFLLKMELKRLATACTRAIDLRGLVDGECQLFDYQGQSHFLDSVGINTFNESIANYGGYTFGVYEAVRNAKNSFRNIYQNEQSLPNSAENQRQEKASTVDKVQYPARLFQLDNYPNRAEERMNFAIPVTLTLSERLQVKANTVDISTQGIKLKLINETSLYKGDRLTITFTGLQEEFQFSKDSVFYFEVKNVLRDSGTQLIGCERIDIPERDSFQRFLNGYIQGNKRRYKINLDNTLAALHSRSFEQFTLVKLNELAVFMDNSNEFSDALAPRYALTTKNNYGIYQYWQDDKKRSTLPYLINSKRFERIKEQQLQGKSLLVFSFVHHHKGRKFFYTIDELQLKNDMAFSLQFLAFAASKSSFAITALNYQEVYAEKAYSPYTLSSAMSKQQGYLNPPLSGDVNAILEHLPYVVSVIDITNSTDISDYQALNYKGINLDRLKEFGHKYAGEQWQVDEIALSFGHQRQEVRFKYKTPAIIECQALSWSGQSADFSVSGLKIELESPAALIKGDEVYLSFPKLQKITSAFDLKQLPYKVMRISKDKMVINLRVSVKEHQHIGRSFFKLLISKNKDKLTPDEYAMLTPGLSGALRTLYAVNMATPTVMVQSSGSRYKLENLVVGKYSVTANKSLLSAMSSLSDRDNYYNLYPILGDLQLSNLLDQQMKKLTTGDIAVSEVVYIAINSKEVDVDKAVTIKIASELNTPELRNFFIKKSLKQGMFFAIELKLSRSDEAHMEHLNPELGYISSYAIHRGKQLEQEIFSVAGLIQLIDVTQEVLIRQNFTH